MDYKTMKEKASQTFNEMVKEFEALLKEIFEDFTSSFVGMLTSDSLVNWEHHLSKYLTIKTRITLIGLSYVNYGIIYR
jgi:hypothetical protein